jgi:hypothetical protein
MAETLINGRPARLPHKDASVEGVRVGWLKLGGKEAMQWRNGHLFLYWEVWTESDKSGRQYPMSGYVVEWSHGGGSGSRRFQKLEDADEYYEMIERENLVEIAVSALGIDMSGNESGPS